MIILNLQILTNLKKDRRSIAHNKKNLIQLDIKNKNYKQIEKKILVKDTGNDSDLAFSFVANQIDFFEKKTDLLI